MYFIAGLIILIALWAMLEQNLLMTRKFLIKSAKIGREFSDTSFVVLADLHNHSFGKDNRRLLLKIEKLKPDYIIIAGDIINKDQEFIPSRGFQLLEKLSEKYKVYYALGNHEQRIKYLSQKEKENTSSDSKQDMSWSEYVNRLSALGIIFLDNHSVTITKNHSRLNIAGVSIGLDYFTKGNPRYMNNDYLNHLLGKRREAVFQILIAHNPMFFQKYAEWGADLVLSGHMHGGLIRLPGIGGLLSPQVKFFPKYDSGKYILNGREMIVSRGLGSHSVMFRLFNPPELLYIKLKK